MHESYGAEFKGGILKRGSEEPRLEKGMSYSTGGCKHWHLRTQSPAASAAGTRRPGVLAEPDEWLSTGGSGFLSVVSAWCGQIPPFLRAPGSDSSMQVLKITKS